MVNVTANQILEQRRIIDAERRQISQSAIGRGTTQQEKGRLRALNSVAQRLEDLQRRQQAGEQISEQRLQQERDLVRRFERQQAASIEKTRAEAKERQRREVAKKLALQKSSIINDSKIIVAKATNIRTGKVSFIGAGNKFYGSQDKAIKSIIKERDKSNKKVIPKGAIFEARIIDIKTGEVKKVKTQRIGDKTKVIQSKKSKLKPKEKKLIIDLRNRQKQLIKKEKTFQQKLEDLGIKLSKIDSKKILENIGKDISTFKLKKLLEKQGTNFFKKFIDIGDYIRNNVKAGFYEGIEEFEKNVKLLEPIGRKLNKKEAKEILSTFVNKLDKKSKNESKKFIDNISKEVSKVDIKEFLEKEGKRVLSIRSKLKLKKKAEKLGKQFKNPKKTLTALTNKGIKVKKKTKDLFTKSGAKIGSVTLSLASAYNSWFQREVLANPIKFASKVILLEVIGELFAGPVRIINKTDDVIKTSVGTFNKIDDAIDAYKKAGVNSRQRTKLGKELRDLIAMQKSAKSSIDDLGKSVNKFNNIKDPVQDTKNIVNDVKKKIDIVKAETKKADKLIKNTKKSLDDIKKKATKIKLKDTTISKKLGDFFKDESNILKSKNKNKLKEIPFNEIKEFKKQINKLDQRIFDLNNKISKSMTTDKAKLRILKEVSTLKKKKKQLNNLLNFQLNALDKLTLKKRKEFFIKLRNVAKEITETSNFQEQLITLTKKLEKFDKDIFDLLFNNKNGLPLKLKKALGIYEKALDLSNLSKAQRGSLLKKIKDINKESFIKLKSELKKLKPKAIVEKNKLSKKQIEDILKPTNSKEILNKRLKNIDKKINFFKSLIPKDKSIKGYDPIIRELETLRNKIITQFKKGLAPLDEKQILRRAKSIQGKINKIKITSRDVINKKSIKSFKVGDFEVEINFKNLGVGFRTQQAISPKLELPKVITIKRLNKKIPMAQLKRYNNNLRKAGKNGINQYNRNLTFINNRRNRLNKLLKNKDLPKTKIKKIKNSLDKLNKFELKNLNIIIKTISSSLRIANALNLAQGNSNLLKSLNVNNLKLKNQQQLKQISQLENIFKKFDKDIIKIEIDTTITKTPPKPPSKPPRKPPKAPPKVPSKPPRKPPKIPPKPPSKPPRKPAINLSNLGFNDRKLANKVLIVKGFVRERKDPNKNFSIKNSRKVKVEAKGTRNQILNQIFGRADRSLVRSGEIKVVGIGKGKKDVALNDRVAKKFRLKKNKQSPVLKFVEEAKHALDTPQEKKEIKTLRKKKKKIISKKISKKSKPKKKVVKKTNKKLKFKKTKKIVKKKIKSSKKKIKRGKK